MGLFRRADREAAGSGGGGGKRKTDPGRPTQERKRVKGAAPHRARAPLRFLLWLIGGIALMAGGGYLVAAVWLFPAPLLPSERVIPRVLGMSEREAARLLAQAGFRAERSSEPHPVTGAGIVTWQDPPPGVAAQRDAAVQIAVSSGPPRAAVPNVAGMDLDLAERLLRAVGLRVEGVDTVAVKGRAPGTAAGTTPAAGDSVTLGRGVIVHLAR
jgi:serine/threonine-protein kinase